MKNTIKVSCAIKGITAKDLAEQVGVSAVQMSHYVTCDQIPSVKVALKMSLVLGVEVKELFILKN